MEKMQKHSKMGQKQGTESGIDVVEPLFKQTEITSSSSMLPVIIEILLESFCSNSDACEGIPIVPHIS